MPNRRELLHIGGLSLLGMNSLQLNRLRAEPASDSPAARHRQNSCIFIFLFGGPSHIDLWDMKPDAPVEVRGDFKQVPTKVPGIGLCEHLPKLACQMDKFTLLRSMTHHMPVHGPACSELYSGRPYFGPPTTDQARPEDWPSLSSLVSRFGNTVDQMPPSVVLPLYSHFIGQSKRIAGQTGGRMGERFNPVLIKCDPARVDFEVQGFKLLPGVGPDRLATRRTLLQRLESSPDPAAVDFGPASATYKRHTETAYSMLNQASFHQAIDLQRVPPSVRERYGYTKFGQSLLMARRLVEAGIPLITVNFDHDSKHDKRSPMWDTHHDNFAKLKDPLCPLFDQAFAAFLQDLDQRGLLATTLVVATGEFGRTPRVGQFSQNAMTLKTGRDHWPYAFTALLAGGGVSGGQAYGQTTRNAGHVADKPVTPADLAATMLYHLGVDSSREYYDEFLQIRQRICEGTPVRDLG